MKVMSQSREQKEHRKRLKRRLELVKIQREALEDAVGIPDKGSEVERILSGYYDEITNLERELEDLGPKAVR